MHFYGHSLGTLVNAKAIDVFQASNAQAPIQDTLFDDASIGNAIGSASSAVEYPSSPLPSRGSTVAIDNYVSAFGSIYLDAQNTVLLRSPDIPVDFGSHTYYLAFHGYPIVWYAKTILTPSRSGLGYAEAIDNDGSIGPMYAPGTFYEQQPVLGEYQIVSTDQQTDAAVLLGRNENYLNFLQIANPELSVAYGAFAEGGIAVVLGVSALDVQGGIQIQNSILSSVAGGAPSQISIFLGSQLYKVEGAAGGARNPSSGSAPGSGPAAYAWLSLAIPSSVGAISLEFTPAGTTTDGEFCVGIDSTPLFQIATPRLANGSTYWTGPLDITAFAGRLGDLFVGLLPISGSTVSGAVTVTNVSFMAVRRPGDADNDGRVGFSDLLILAQHYGEQWGQTPSDGDFTGDGAVGFDDLLILAQNYGTGSEEPGDRRSVRHRSASFAPHASINGCGTGSCSCSLRLVVAAGRRIYSVEFLRQSKYNHPFRSLA